MSRAAAVALAWLCLAPASALAQPSPPARDSAGWLSGRLAMSSAERLIASPSSDDRVRGVVRLSSIAGREAVERLVRALQPGSALARDPRAALAAARGLFPFASREPVRRLFGSWLSADLGSDPMASMVRDTAALALAASDDSPAIDVLVAAVARGGASADAASRALIAYPPKSFVPLVSAGRQGEGLPAGICDLVGRLGDLRAIDLLKARVGAGLPVIDADPAAPPPIQDRRTAAIAAARALARLGDREHVAVVRGWLRARDPAVRNAAAEILVEGGAPEGAHLIGEWMRADDTRTKAVWLALRTPSVELLPDLVSVARAGPVDLVGVAIAALGRIDDARAVTPLAPMLQDPARAWSVAFALANGADGSARAVLERALSDARTRRLAVRAGIARALIRDDPPHGLSDAMAALRVSPDDADRAAAAFGLAVLREVSVRSLVASRDAAVVRAAARASLFVGGDAVTACVERLVGETDETTRAALGIALAGSPRAADPVATDTLAQWAESGGALAPLAALSLGFRDGPSSKERLARLVASADPVLRRHAAFALGASPEPDASSRLAAAWRFETDTTVRRAIVVGLSGRSEPQRIEVLEQASRMDPDAQVRETARLGLSGGLPGILARRDRPGIAWITLTPNDVASAPMVRARTGCLQEASGLALPVVTDPDGALVVPGLVPGASSFTLAMRAARYEASSHE